jgi:hypothetical protein
MIYTILPNDVQQGPYTPPINTMPVIHEEFTVPMPVLGLAALFLILYLTRR